MLGFIGIDEVRTIRAEGLDVTALAGDAVPKALRAVQDLDLQALG